MKLNKLISAFLAVSMLTVSFATIANADASYEYDDGYYIDNIEKVSERQVSVEITDVHQMSAEDVATLKENNNTSFTSKSLGNGDGKYGNTSQYTMYRVDAVVKGVGNLVQGYERTKDGKAWIKLMIIDISWDFLNIADKVVAQSVAKTTDATTGKAWSGDAVDSGTDSEGNPYKRFSVLQYLGTDLIPANETDENDMINANYPFTMYFVLAKGDTVTISTATSSAISYNINNGLEAAYKLDLPVQTASFTLKEASTEPETEDIEVEAPLVEFTNTFEVDGETFKHGAALFSFSVAANNNPVKYLNAEVTDADNGTKPTKIELPVTIEAVGTVKVGLNILNVPAAIESITFANVVTSAN